MAIFPFSNTYRLRYTRLTHSTRIYIYIYIDYNTHFPLSDAHARGWKNSRRVQYTAVWIADMRARTHSLTRSLSLSLSALLSLFSLFFSLHSSFLFLAHSKLPIELYQPALGCRRPGSSPRGHHGAVHVVCAVVLHTHTHTHTQ